MRGIRIFAAAATVVAILFWLTRSKPEEVLRGVIGGPAPASLTLLETGWGAGGGELVSFVHFRIDPKALAPLLRARRFKLVDHNERDIRGQMDFWKPPAWWDPAKLAGPVVRYRGVGPEPHDDVPWTMDIFVDAADSEAYGVRNEWWR